MIGEIGNGLLCFSSTNGQKSKTTVFVPIRHRTREDPLFKKGSECSKGDIEPDTFHGLWRQCMRAQEVIVSRIDRVQNSFKLLRLKFRTMGTMVNDKFSIYKCCQKYMYSFHRYVLSPSWQTNEKRVLCCRSVPEQTQALNDSEKGAVFSFYPKLVSNQVRLAQKKLITDSEKFLGAFGGMAQWLTQYVLDRVTQDGKIMHEKADDGMNQASTKEMKQLNFVDACLHAFPYSIIRFVRLLVYSVFLPFVTCS